MFGKRNAPLQCKNFILSVKHGDGSLMILAALAASELGQPAENFPLVGLIKDYLILTGRNRFGMVESKS